LFQRAKREPRSFRHRGIGPELLRCVFTFAVEKGMKRIVAKIKSDDYSKNPNLLKWYADMGFTVTIKTEPSTVVAIISKEL
jgi:L-amino acid N-acyltransferase YncA